MSEQVPMWENRGYSTGLGSVDALERYYTPDALARFCVGLLPWEGDDRVLEPHAGGGAFVRAVQEHTRYQFIGGYDLDPNCWAVRNEIADLGDWLTADVPSGLIHRVIGNPPFSNAEEHVDQGLRVAPEVAFLLPMSRWDAHSRCGWWQNAPLRHVWVLSRRIWPGSRQCGFFWFDKHHKGAATVEIVDQGEM